MTESVDTARQAAEEYLDALRSASLPATLKDANANLTKLLASITRKQDELRRELDREASDGDRTSLESSIKNWSKLRHEIGLKQRKELLACKTRLSSSLHSHQRLELLENGANGVSSAEASKASSATPSDAGRTSQEATLSLRRARQQMASNLQLTNASLTSLSSTSQTVSDTITASTGVASSVQTSASLLTKLVRRRQTDKLLVYMAFGFFLCCVLYIVFARLGIRFW